MEKKQPLISILVPFFNRKKLLMECVNSIIQSSYSNIEVICIDDCSTDGTYKEIEKIASNDRRVRLYRNKRNIGIGLNRNLLISKAKGEYVMFVDSDDLIHKDLIKILYTAITKSNRNIAFCNYSSHINKVLNKDNSIPKQYVFNSSHEMLSYLFNGKNETKNQQEGLPFYSIYFFLWGKLYKKSIWKDIKFSNVRIYEDGVVTSLLYEKAIKSIYIDTPLYYYRSHNEQLFSSKQQTEPESCIGLIQELHDIFVNTIYVKHKDLSKMISTKLVEFLENVIIASLTNKFEHWNMLLLKKVYLLLKDMIKLLA